MLKNIDDSGKNGKNLARRILLAITAMLAVATWLLLRVPAYDLAKVHPALKAIALPCRKVEAHWFTDGGSISLRILDGSGKEHWLFIPTTSFTGGPPYPAMLLGARGKRDPAGVRVSCGEQDKRFIASLIEDYANHDYNRTGCLDFLRDLPRDRLRSWWDSHFQH